MQLLKSLTFVRIGSANSHKYTINKKQLRAFRNLCKKIDQQLKDFECNYNILDWTHNVYEEDWSYSKGVEYYKGKVASKELINYKELQEAYIGVWTRSNKELFDSFNKLKTYVRFSKDSYHSPPQTRGLYAFPQYRLETFLTHWDANKLIVRHNKNGQELKPRVKKYITIKYNKPTLWCHFIDEAKQLKVDIRVNKYWVLINSCDYLKVLSLWEKRRLREHRNSISNKFGLIKHCYQYGSKDDLEVFLVGV